MKLLLLAASHRPDSYNRKLIDCAAAYLKQSAVEHDVIDFEQFDLPLFNDKLREAGQMPKGLEEMRSAVSSYDGIVIASPEYNWSIPAALKNLIDWLSHYRPLPTNGQTAFLMCATPSIRGGITGMNHLKTSLESIGMHVYPDIFTLSLAHEGFAEDNSLLNPECIARQCELLEAYVTYTRKIRSL